MTSHLLAAGHAHEANGVLRILVKLNIADVGCCVLLAVPPGRSEITVSVVLGVVQAKFKAEKISQTHQEEVVKLKVRLLTRLL